MSAIEVPVNPWRANSSRAMSRIRCRVPPAGLADLAELVVLAVRVVLAVPLVPVELMFSDYLLID
jgi:hypothetical protein